MSDDPKIILPEIILVGGAVTLPAEMMSGRVRRLYGKGTKSDPVVAVVDIPAQTRYVRVSKLTALDPADGR